MYLERDQRHSLRGFGVYILEDHVARERIAGLECSHIETNVDIKRREIWKRSCDFGNGGGEGVDVNVKLINMR